MDRPLMSVGNHKLSKTILVFNLNRAVTCPGRTPWCEKHCYERKSYRYPAVRPARDRNLAATMEDSFVPKIVAEITKTRKTPIRGVRIHGSGDFYSLEYLEKWFEIARQCPGIHFKANTRSWMLPYRNKPDNLRLRYSVDVTTKRGTMVIMKDQVDAFAYIQGAEPPGTPVCEYQCGFGDDECSYCYHNTNHITFPVH